MSEILPPLPEAGGLNPSSNGAAVKNVTQLLGKAGAGDDAIRNELFKAVYAELRAIAVRKMASERLGHILHHAAV